MKAADIMTREVITINEEATIEELCDVLQEKNVNGLPVVDDHGSLTGVVTMMDIIYGAMGRTIHETKEKKKRIVCSFKGGLASELAKEENVVKVKDIMTSPAIFINEETPLIEIGTILWNFRIHRIPVVKDEKVTGIISSLDFCRAISTGRIKA